MAGFIFLKTKESEACLDEKQDQLKNFLKLVFQTIQEAIKPATCK